jgi:Toprim domain
VLTFNDIDHLTGGKIGMFDVPCPICGPEKSIAGQKRKVLRLWWITPAFATYCCVRCDVQGHVRDDGAPKPDPAELEKARAEARLHAAATAEDKRKKACWLWARRHAASGTIAEVYLRKVRRYDGPLPPSIGFLPPRGAFPPSMISAFAFPDDAGLPEVRAVHLTRLKTDGSGKAGAPDQADKIMIGTPRGVPIALAPINDGLGLAITEGIENGLSIHAATGLGVWAAGAAPFLPGLGAAVPDYVDEVSIVADPDPAGRRFAGELAAALRGRRIPHRVLIWGRAVA